MFIVIVHIILYVGGSWLLFVVVISCQSDARLQANSIRAAKKWVALLVRGVAGHVGLMFWFLWQNARKGSAGTDSAAAPTPPPPPPPPPTHPPPPPPPPVKFCRTFHENRRGTACSNRNLLPFEIASVLCWWP